MREELHWSLDQPVPDREEQRRRTGLRIRLLGVGQVAIGLALTALGLWLIGLIRYAGPAPRALGWLPLLVAFKGWLELLTGTRLVDLSARWEDSSGFRKLAFGMLVAGSVAGLLGMIVFALSQSGLKAWW
jgi:hypothetical protein